MIQREAGIGQVPILSGDGRYVFYVNAANKAVRWEISTGSEKDVPYRSQSVSDDGDKVAYEVVPDGFVDPSAVGYFDVSSGANQEIDANNGVTGPSGIEVSGDGAVVFFTTWVGLDTNDTNSLDDAYRWNPATSGLDWAAEDQRMLAVSDDGSAAVGCCAPSPGASGAVYTRYQFTGATPPVPVAPVSLADLAAGQLEDQVKRIYQAFFLRAPDEGGRDFWMARRVAGTSLAQISDSFAGSDEFVETYGSLLDSAFVDLVYTNVLGRTPDAGGRAHWIGQLTGGLSRGAMMVGFSESPEFIVQTNTLPV